MLKNKKIRNVRSYFFFNGSKHKNTFSGSFFFILLIFRKLYGA